MPTHDTRYPNGSVSGSVAVDTLLQAQARDLKTDVEIRKPHKAAADAFEAWMRRVDQALEFAASQQSVVLAARASELRDLAMSERIEALETFVRHHREEVTLSNESHHNSRGTMRQRMVAQLAEASNWLRDNPEVLP